MDPTWLATTHEGLTARQMHDLLRLRHRVFVREQECPAYDDVDGLDVADDTVHVLAARDGELLAYGRVLAPARHRHGAGHDGGPDGGPRIGRVVVDMEARGTGLGREVVRRSVAVCDERWPGLGVGLSAQAHLLSLYEQFGFVAASEVYADEDGIPHVDMARPAPAPRPPA